MHANDDQSIQEDPDQSNLDKGRTDLNLVSSLFVIFTIVSSVIIIIFTIVIIIINIIALSCYIIMVWLNQCTFIQTVMRRHTNTMGGSSGSDEMWQTISSWTDEIYALSVSGGIAIFCDHFFLVHPPSSPLHIKGLAPHIPILASHTTT